MTIDRTPYTMTLTPGANLERMAAQAARYIVDRWMPGNAGGVHVLMTPRLAMAIANIARKATAPIYVRVTIEGNRPCLTVIDD